MNQIVHARLSKKDAERLEALVKEGHYSNTSDAVRQAVRFLVQNQDTAVNFSVKKGTTWESALKEAEGHLEVALEIFHKKLEKEKK